MAKKTIEIPGINIQWPWAHKLLNGTKTVETRRYPLPEKYTNKYLAVIETPGPNGKKAGVAGSKIIGVIKFGSCFKYKSRQEWSEDRSRHLVDVSDKSFQYTESEDKWGWLVVKTYVLERPVAPPRKRGIIYALECRVPESSISGTRAL